MKTELLLFSNISSWNQICHYLPLVNLVLTSWVSVENNYSNYINSGGLHLVFNGHSYTRAQVLILYYSYQNLFPPHFKKSFLELGFSSREKRGTWVHGFWPSWADAPAASQKCWVGAEMQQSCHYKLEKEKKKYRGFIYHWGVLVTSP